jgi:hypothetical protein
MNQGSLANGGPFADISGALHHANWPNLRFAVAALDDADWANAITAVRESDRTPKYIARRYARGHAAHWRLEGLIEEVVIAPESDARWTLLAAVGTLHTGAAGPIPAGLPRHGIQARAVERHDRGVLLVLRRGSGRCLTCSERLPSTSQRVTASDGRKWSVPCDYCPDCERKLGEVHRPNEYSPTPAEWKALDRARARRNGSDRRAIDGVLDELAAGDPRTSRATTRRRKRAARGASGHESGHEHPPETRNAPQTRGAS